MAKDFARKFKKLVSAQVDGQSDNLIGTVLSVHPIEISCHGGQWLLTADDLQISNHVRLHTGDSVVLSGEDPFSVISVLSDVDPDEYEPPASMTVDDELSDTSTNAVQNKVVTKALQEAASDRDRISDAVISMQMGVDAAAHAASAAQKTADQADVKADSAQSTADLALTAAGTAQSTADTAVSKADAAQTAADAAQADATKALNKFKTLTISGKTDTYGKIAMPDKSYYPIASLSRDYTINGDNNTVRVLNTTTDAPVIAKNATVNFNIIGMLRS